MLNNNCFKLTQFRFSLSFFSIYFIVFTLSNLNEKPTNNSEHQHEYATSSHCMDAPLLYIDDCTDSNADVLTTKASIGFFHPITKKPCPVCSGYGRLRYDCSRCSGGGVLYCNTCNGRGNGIAYSCSNCSSGSANCTSCSGLGYKTYTQLEGGVVQFKKQACWSCNGAGKIRCPACSGSGKGRAYICKACQGNSMINCNSCSAKGYYITTCTNCAGSGQVAGN